MSKRPLASQAEVKSKINEIRAFHALGRKSFNLPVDTSIRAMAKRLGCKAGSLGKARQFAHPKTGYSRGQLAQLCSLLKHHRPVFGVTHIEQLVTVPEPEREELQHLCIEKNLSVRQLKLARKNQAAPRSRGGRRPQVTAESALV